LRDFLKEYSVDNLTTIDTASLRIEKVCIILQHTTQTETKVPVIIVYEIISHVADIDYNKITKTLHITYPKITLLADYQTQLTIQKEKTDPNNLNLSSTLYYHHRDILIHDAKSAQTERNLRVNIMNPPHDTIVMNIEKVLKLRRLDLTQYTIIILIDKDSNTTKAFIKASIHQQVKQLTSMTIFIKLHESSYFFQESITNLDDSKTLLLSNISRNLHSVSNIKHFFQ
jgi:hypothetical protein